ncbi:EPG5-like protein [Mya arenaria]|uniref:EPG5-like protein n=1 Tax=Mya arenaria TaxID=6604 RepID=A0ABY7FV08_MYAAR|nr:EPG5-like protein [Mya arenaria]
MCGSSPSFPAASKADQRLPADKDPTKVFQLRSCDDNKENGRSLARKTQKENLLKDVTESPDIKTKPKETVKPAVTVVTEANKADVAEGSAKISDNASSKVLTAETNDNDTAFTAENTQEEENENDKESEEKTECEETNDIGKEVENQNDVTATSPLVECSGETCVDVLMKNKNEDAVGENIEPEEVEREQPNPEPDINTERISGVHEEQPACKLYPDISEQLEQFMKEEQQIHILDVPITETNVDELKDDAQLESPSETQPVETYNPRIIDASAPPPSGTCGDGYKCQGSHLYESAKLDINALSCMTMALKNIQETIQNELSLHSYSAQLSRLQVESYIHDLFANSPDLMDIPKNLPVSGCDHQSRNVRHQVEKLLDCISVLFVFHRQPIEDEEMVKNLQIWTERLVAPLLRVGFFEDHLFILNHIMRCPSGIGTWASMYIQAPPIPSNTDPQEGPLMFGNTQLDHMIAALSTVLIPTSYRNEFMCQMQKLVQTGRDNKNISWVLVDEDGDEDDDPQNSWLYLHENDVVAILRQLSLAAIYRHVFFIDPAQQPNSFTLGSWQYIADMPFNSISKGTMWRILWLLHQDGSHDQSHDTTFIPPAGECISFVKDIDCRSQLSDILQRVPPTEGVYLLNAMTNMTQCCTSADVSFIESVTLAVFEVSFVCTETRDFCSKMGRELLGAVVTCHPFMLSVLTQHVNEYLDKLGQMGIYLYKGLPMETWLPTDQDLTVVRQWLLSTALGSPANQMAQQILASINWGTTQRGNRLMVPWPLHRQVAVLVVEAYQTFIHGKHLGSMIMEGVKQMSAAVQQYQTAEQEFHSWCWTLLLKLSLHQTSLPENDRHQSSQPGAIPDFSDDSLMPLVKGVREKNPTACFVVLLMTKVGHGLTEFISEGLAMLDMLMEQGLPTPTISAIYFTMFLFVDQQKYILDNVKFQEVLLSILRADESYFKVVKGLLSYDFPGPITKLLTSMILSHIKAGGDVGGEGMVQVLEMWTQLFFNLPNWHSDRNSCYVMDNLIKVAFTSKPALEKVQQIFTEQYKNYCNREKSQGMVTSFVNWVTSGVTLPTYLDKSSCGEFSWLTYMILWVEGSFELETKLWPTIQEELLANPKAGTEQCLKKSINKLKLEQAPVWARLNIIRLAQQALDMPKEHPVAVLTWQRFFGLFLGRLNMTQAPSPQKATVGERFFSSLGYTSYVKKMKKRLGETADHYMKLAAEVKPWMELVDLKGVSSDVNTMTTEWKSNSVTPQTPKKKGRKGNEPRHSGANDILSRLSRLEEPLPPPSIHPMKSPVPEMSRSVLENKGSLLHLLNADLSTLVDYAGNHATHMAELKRLDDIYVDKITELFKNVRQQVTISLKCTSMINPLHKCSKPGAAVAWIEEKWNDRNQQRQADENRGDYKQRIIACKVHFSNKSIVAAIHTENAITMLVKIYRASTDDTQRDMLSSIGCSLFFRLGEVITDSVLDYPPTKQFFSSCIDILGKEFVQSQSSQSEPVLKLSLDRPEIGGMFAPHFKPNLSPRAFVPMYGTLVQQIRSEREGSVRERGNSGGVNLQVVAMLLTKFDVLAWLEQCGPSRQEVKKLIENLSLAFMACGPSPQDGYDTLFHLYLNHERKILHFRFPLYLNEVLAALLQGLDKVWKSVVESYAPWLQTVTVQKVASLPWLTNDREVASHMVQSLAHFVGYAHYKTQDIQQMFYNDFLSLLWLYFAIELCKADSASEVVSLMNLEFSKLPWKQLMPNIHVLDTMARLRETGCSMGFNLVCDILALINWPQVTSFYENHANMEVRTRFQGAYFLLLIQAFTENKHIESPEVESILNTATSSKWEFLSADDFKKACGWLLQSCDPKCLLQSRTSPDGIGFRQLESAAGFNTEVSTCLTDVWIVKRLSYLHAVTSLVCQLTYLPDIDPDTVSKIVINLITEVETVESAVPDTRLQYEESVDMMKEVLSLLNNSNPDNRGAEVIMVAILDWLQGSPQTILLSPCIHAATRHLASLSNMVKIVEQCIELAFVTVQMPELNLTEFFQACLQESAYLLMFCHVRQQIPLCQSLAEEQGLIEMMLDWTERAKPSIESESKLLLWWYKAVDMIFRQIDCGQQKTMSKVKVFGEDRASEGLLGAIGLGRKSQLSEKFRVCCRALVAFCCNQILGDNTLRLSSQDPVSNLSAAKQDTASLLSIKSNKKYQQIREQVERSCDFVTDQSKCLRDALGLLCMLKGMFYAEKDYLSVILVT